MRDAAGRAARAIEMARAAPSTPTTARPSARHRPRVAAVATTQVEQSQVGHLGPRARKR